jgi:hypothetical protein
VKAACVHKLVCRVRLCRLAALRRDLSDAGRAALVDDHRDLSEVRRDAKDICRERCQVRRDVRHRLGGRELDGQRVVQNALNRACLDAVCAAAFRAQGRLECE